MNDTMKDTAIKILNDELGIKPIEIKRFQTGYCHSVYHVKAQNDEFVLRITSKENKEYYLGSIKWLSELYKLEIPVPKLIKYGQYEDVFFTQISVIPGNDLGEVYNTLDNSQKDNIVKELAKIQRKTAALPNFDSYGYPHSKNSGFKTWGKYLESLIERSYSRIEQNKVFNTDICEKVKLTMNSFDEYFSKILPTAFLDDITTKNVLVFEGNLSGIVDIDEMCYGDPLLVIGLTNMALLAMETDTKYIEYWLDEIGATDIQRKVVIFYTLLFCIDFMSEQGMRFSNDTIITCDQKKLELLNSIYCKLLEELNKVNT